MAQRVGFRQTWPEEEEDGISPVSLTGGVDLDEGHVGELLAELVEEGVDLAHGWVASGGRALWDPRRTSQGAAYLLALAAPGRHVVHHHLGLALDQIVHVLRVLRTHPEHVIALSSSAPTTIGRCSCTPRNQVPHTNRTSQDKTTSSSIAHLGDDHLGSRLQGVDLCLLGSPRTEVLERALRVRHDRLAPWDAHIPPRVRRGLDWKEGKIKTGQRQRIPDAGRGCLNLGVAPCTDCIRPICCICVSGRAPECTDVLALTPPPFVLTWLPSRGTDFTIFSHELVGLQQPDRLGHRSPHRQVVHRDLNHTKHESDECRAR
jgi:hypothetical protein